MTLTNILSGVLILLQLITLVLLRSAGKRSGTTYQPMMLFMLAGLVLTVNQTIGTGKIFGIHINADLQTLMAALFVTWQARRWQVFERPVLYWTVICLFIVSWAAGWIFMEQFNGNSSLFLIISSFGITLMAIEMINRNLPQSRIPFHRNTIFLFSAGLLFYYTLLSLVELYSFSFSLSSPGSPFNTHYFDITIRLFVQLLFIRSVLCIPAKDNYYSY
jgi:hypothetical protein